MRAGRVPCARPHVLSRAVAGWITVAIGVALVVASYVERRTVPTWVPRVAIATIALGISTLVALRPGIAPSIVSSAFSLVAIVLLVSVIVRMVRRPR